MDVRNEHWDDIQSQLFRHDGLPNRSPALDAVGDVDNTDSMQQLPRTVIPVPAPHARDLCRNLSSLDNVAQAVLAACSRNEDGESESYTGDARRGHATPVIDDELVMAMTELTANVYTSSREKNLLTSIIALAEKLYETRRRLANSNSNSQQQQLSSYSDLSHLYNSCSRMKGTDDKDDGYPSINHEGAKARYEQGLVMSRILTILGGSSKAEMAATLPSQDLTFHALRELQKCNEVVGDVLSVAHLHISEDENEEDSMYKALRRIRAHLMHDSEPRSPGQQDQQHKVHRMASLVSSTDLEKAPIHNSSIELGRMRRCVAQMTDIIECYGDVTEPEDLPALLVKLVCEVEQRRREQEYDSLLLQQYEATVQQTLSYYGECHSPSVESERQRLEASRARSNREELQERDGAEDEHVLSAIHPIDRHVRSCRSVGSRDAISEQSNEYDSYSGHTVAAVAADKCGSNHSEAACRTPRRQSAARTAATDMPSTPWLNTVLMRLRNTLACASVMSEDGTSSPPCQKSWANESTPQNVNASSIHDAIEERPKYCLSDDCHDTFHEAHCRLVDRIHRLPQALCTPRAAHTRACISELVETACAYVCYTSSMRMKQEQQQQQQRQHQDDALAACMSTAVQSAPSQASSDPSSALASCFSPSPYLWWLHELLQCFPASMQIQLNLRPQDNNSSNSRSDVVTEKNVKAQVERLVMVLRALIGEHMMHTLVTTKMQEFTQALCRTMDVHDSGAYEECSTTSITHAKQANPLRDDNRNNSSSDDIMRSYRVDTAHESAESDRAEAGRSLSLPCTGPALVTAMQTLEQTVRRVCDCETRRRQSWHNSTTAALHRLTQETHTATATLTQLQLLPRSLLAAVNSNSLGHIGMSNTSHDTIHLQSSTNYSSQGYLCSNNAHGILNSSSSNSDNVMLHHASRVSQNAEEGAGAAGTALQAAVAAVTARCQSWLVQQQRSQLTQVHERASQARVTTRMREGVHRLARLVDAMMAATPSSAKAHVGKGKKSEDGEVYDSENEDAVHDRARSELPNASFSSSSSTSSSSSSSYSAAAVASSSVATKAAAHLRTDTAQEEATLDDLLVLLVERVSVLQRRWSRQVRLTAADRDRVANLMSTHETWRARWREAQQRVCLMAAALEIEYNEGELQIIRPTNNKNGHMTTNTQSKSSSQHAPKSNKKAKIKLTNDSDVWDACSSSESDEGYVGKAKTQQRQQITSSSFGSSCHAPVRTRHLLRLLQRVQQCVCDGTPGSHASHAQHSANSRYNSAEENKNKTIKNYYECDEEGGTTSDSATCQAALRVVMHKLARDGHDIKVVLYQLGTDETARDELIGEILSHESKDKNEELEADTSTARVETWLASLLQKHARWTARMREAVEGHLAVQQRLARHMAVLCSYFGGRQEGSLVSLHDDVNNDYRVHGASNNENRDDSTNRKNSSYDAHEDASRNKDRLPPELTNLIDADAFLLECTDVIMPALERCMGGEPRYLSTSCTPTTAAAPSLDESRMARLQETVSRLHTLLTSLQCVHYLAIPVATRTRRSGETELLFDSSYHNNKSSANDDDDDENETDYKQEVSEDAYSRYHKQSDNVAQRCPEQFSRESVAPVTLPPRELNRTSNALSLPPRPPDNSSYNNNDVSIYKHSQRETSGSAVQSSSSTPLHCDTRWRYIESHLQRVYDGLREFSAGYKTAAILIQKDTDLTERLLNQMMECYFAWAADSAAEKESNTHRVTNDAVKKDGDSSVIGIKSHDNNNGGRPGEDRDAEGDEVMTVRRELYELLCERGTRMKGCYFFSRIQGVGRCVWTDALAHMTEVFVRVVGELRERTRAMTDMRVGMEAGDGEGGVVNLCIMYVNWAQHHQPLRLHHRYSYDGSTSSNKSVGDSAHGMIRDGNSESADDTLSLLPPGLKSMCVYANPEDREAVSHFTAESAVVKVIAHMFRLIHAQVSHAEPHHNDANHDHRFVNGGMQTNRMSSSDNTDKQPNQDDAAPLTRVSANGRHAAAGEQQRQLTQRCVELAEERDAALSAAAVARAELRRWKRQQQTTHHHSGSGMGYTNNSSSTVDGSTESSAHNRECNDNNNTSKMNATWCDSLKNATANNNSTDTRNNISDTNDVSSTRKGGFLSSCAGSEQSEDVVETLQRLRPPALTDTDAIRAYTRALEAYVQLRTTSSNENYEQPPPQATNEHTKHSNNVNESKNANNTDGNGSTSNPTDDEESNKCAMPVHWMLGGDVRINSFTRMSPNGLVVSPHTSSYVQASMSAGPARLARTHRARVAATDTSRANNNNNDYINYTNNPSDASDGILADAPYRRRHSLSPPSREESVTVHSDTQPHQEYFLRDTKHTRSVLREMARQGSTPTPSRRGQALLARAARGAIGRELRQPVHALTPRSGITSGKRSASKNANSNSCNSMNTQIRAASAEGRGERDEVTEGVGGMARWRKVALHDLAMTAAMVHQRRRGA